MKTYSKEFKLNVVKDHIAGGGGAKLLGRKHGVSEEKVRTWVSRFRLHGEAGLSAKRSVYSTDFKLEVLYRQEREQLSSRQVAALYDIRNPNQVVCWRKRLNAEGLQEIEDKRGSPPQVKKDTQPSSPRADVSGANDSGATPALREENERLRAEVAYLKKLSASIRMKRSVALRKRALSLD